MYRKAVALMELRVQIMEKKLDSHNGNAKMFAKTAEEIGQIKTDVAVIKAKMEFIK